MDRRQVFTDRNTENIRCPFFRRHSDRSIRCSGFIDGQTLYNQFRKGATRIWWESVYCAGDFKKCEICRALWDQYEEINPIDGWKDE